MEYQIVVPNIDDFDDVEVIEILVAAGDTVAIDDSVVTLESEKATMEVPSPKAGTVDKIQTQLGDKVHTGTVLLTLTLDATDDNQTSNTPVKEQSDSPSLAKPTQTAQTEVVATPAEAVNAKKTSDDTTLHASPSVRQFARELGVNLAAVDGSGPKGRITRADVVQFFRSTVMLSRDSAKQISQTDFKRFGPTRSEPLSRIQQVVAKRLHHAWSTIPHVTQHDDADVAEIEAYCKEFNEQLSGDTPKLRLLPFLVKALVFALQKFPHFNASLEDDNTLLIREYYHIGIAVDTPEGLLVPVIKNADKKDIQILSHEIIDLATRAHDKKLSPSDMQGGCMTVSNLGKYSTGRLFTPIVNAPEVAIIGASGTRTVAEWDGEQFIPKLVLPLDLSYDHRVINGAEASLFLREYCDLLKEIKPFLEDKINDG